MFVFNGSVDWIFKQHRDTNHKYDRYLPYEFHLNMVVQVYEDFKNLLPQNYITKEVSAYHNTFVTEDDTHEAIILACYGHDLIEDTRCSYNDIKQRLGENPADIIYALTNEKGRNRAERGNDRYYEGIRNTDGAIFVKLCDRIANVQYSKMTRSRMFEMYQKENEDFMKKVNADMYPPMKTYLINLFKD